MCRAIEKKWLCTSKQVNDLESNKPHHEIFPLKNLLIKKQCQIQTLIRAYGPLSPVIQLARLKYFILCLLWIHSVPILQQFQKHMRRCQWFIYIYQLYIITSIYVYGSVFPTLVRIFLLIAISSLPLDKVISSCTPSKWPPLTLALILAIMVYTSGPGKTCLA